MSDTELYDIDDEAADLEAWEAADAELARQGLSDDAREAVWKALAPEGQRQAEQLIQTVMDQHGIGPEEAFRALMALDGKEV